MSTAAVALVLVITAQLPLGFAFSSTVPALQWSHNLDGVKEIVDYRVLSPRDLAKSVAICCLQSGRSFLNSSLIHRSSCLIASLVCPLPNNSLPNRMPFHPNQSRFLDNIIERKASTTLSSFKLYEFSPSTTSLDRDKLMQKVTKLLENPILKEMVYIKKLQVYCSTY